MRGGGIGQTGSGAIADANCWRRGATDRVRIVPPRVRALLVRLRESISARSLPQRFQCSRIRADSSPDATGRFAWASAPGVGDAVAGAVFCLRRLNCGGVAIMTGSGPAGAEDRCAAIQFRLRCASLGASRSFGSIETQVLLALPGSSGASVAAPICRAILRVNTST